MNNEDKILELLAESLQKLDQQGETLNKHGEILETHGTQIQKLVNVQVTQTEIMRRMADDINELKNRDVGIEDLEKRVSELERYTGKK